MIKRIIFLIMLCAGISYGQTGSMDYVMWDGTNLWSFLGSITTDCGGTVMCDCFMLTGKGGGQTAYGGTGITDRLVLKASTANTNLHVSLGDDFEISNGDFKMGAGDSVDMTAGAYFKPFRYSQTNQPTPQTNGLVIWYNTANSNLYVVFEDPVKGTVKSELQ